MSAGSRRPTTAEYFSAAVTGSEVPGPQQVDHSARTLNNASSTGPLPVHLSSEGGTEKYDWKGSKYHHSSGSEADRKAVGVPHRPATPLSPTPRHSLPTGTHGHPSTGPLPSRPDIPTLRKPHSRPVDVDLTSGQMPPHNIGSVVPRPLDSPTYSSGNMSSGELRAEGCGQASSFGSNARMVYGNDSYPFDKDQLKAVPKAYGILNTKTAASTQSTDTLTAGQGDGAKVGDGAKAGDAGYGSGESCKSTPSSVHTDEAKNPRLSGGEGSGESHSYSTQSSVLTEGGYSTQESGGDHTDDDRSNKMLLQEGSIGLDAVKRIRKESQQGGRVDHRGAEGVAGGKGESQDAGVEGEVEKRPFQKQVSTGKGKHHLLGLGRGTSRPVNSLGGYTPGNGSTAGNGGTLGNGGAGSAENKELTLTYLLSRREEEIRDLKKQLADRDEMMKGEGGTQDLRSQQEEYDELRHKTSELQRLQSVEQHEKRLQGELSSCKKDKDAYEDQVMQLTKQLSLLDNERSELAMKCDQLSAEGEGLRLSAEGEGLGPVYEENKRLGEEVSSLRKEVQKKDGNVRKMKDRVKNLTQQVAIGDGQGHLSLGSLEMEGVAGSGVVETEEVQKQVSQFPHGLSSGSGIGAEHEVELASLRQELVKKGEVIQQLSSQQDRVEEMARNMTAMMTYTQQSSASIKSLSEKCTRLEEENDLLLTDKNKMSSSLTELSSVSGGLKVEVEALRREKVLFDSSSELEEACKQVQLLQDQLEDQQRVSEKQLRELKLRDDKLKKCDSSINNLQQEVVLHRGLSQNVQQDLMNSQQVATALSSKCEEQAMELDQLKREKEELFGELQAQKVVSAGYEEDFNEERKDREKAHSKMADMETQYKHQFNKLGEELAVSRQYCERLERRLKETESVYQAQVSQAKYSTGDKDKNISKLQADNKRLEEELGSKMQQVKQYKKQADHHVMELNSFRDAHIIQKSQIQEMGMDTEKMQKQLELLQRENTNFKARDRHIAATGGGRTGGGATLEVEVKRIHELEGSVEELQVTNAILQSKVEQYQKQAQSQATPISSSSSRDRVGHHNPSALPSRPPYLGNQGKASSVDSSSRVRRDLDLPQYSTPIYSDHSKQLPSLKGGNGSGAPQRFHTSHALSHQSNIGTRTTQPTPDPYSNVIPQTNASTSSLRLGNPHYYATSNTDFQTVPSASNAGRHGVGVSSRPSPQYSVGVNAGSYASGGRPSMQGSTSTAGDAAALSGGGRGNNFISRNYGQSGSSGPSSLPGGLLSPEHKTDPHRGHYGQGARHSRDDMDLRGESEFVEKDSPPTSFVSSPGPSSLDNQQLPSASLGPLARRNYSHQLPNSRGQSAAGVVEQERDGRDFMTRPRPNLLQGQVGTRVGPSIPRTGPSLSNGSMMRQSKSAGSGIGHIHAPTRPGGRGQDLATNYPRKYPLQETAATSSGHAPLLKRNNPAKSPASLSSNQLELGIDCEIISAAEEVKSQVGSKGAGQEDAPYDPNLECPTCGKSFRIGQIQLFRQHAASCNNKI